MLDRLDWVHPRVEELGVLLSDPQVVQDQQRWRALMQEHSRLEPLDAAARRYAQLLAAREEVQAMLEEPEMAGMAREELEQLARDIPAAEREIQLLLLPRDPDEDRNVVMEIRSGAGGEEAALFGAMLMRMYTRYAERHGWRVEMMDANMTELGGVKEAVFTISGAVIAPSMPVKITAATVTGTMPPSVSDTAIAMGVVTDLGSMVAASSSDSPNALHSRVALTIDATEPTRHPTTTGTKYRPSTFRWL